jgi:hypothetical protein
MDFPTCGQTTGFVTRSSLLKAVASDTFQSPLPFFSTQISHYLIIAPKVGPFSGVPPLLLIATLDSSAVISFTALLNIMSCTTIVLGSHSTMQRKLREPYRVLWVNITRAISKRHICGLFGRSATPLVLLRRWTKEAKFIFSL